jgi:hypothetical protein
MSLGPTLAQPVHGAEHCLDLRLEPGHVACPVPSLPKHVSIENHCGCGELLGRREARATGGAAVNDRAGRGGGLVGGAAAGAAAHPATDNAARTGTSTATAAREPRRSPTRPGIDISASPRPEQCARLGTRRAAPEPWEKDDVSVPRDLGERELQPGREPGTARHADHPAGPVPASGQVGALNLLVSPLEPQVAGRPLAAEDILAGSAQARRMRRAACTQSQLARRGGSDLADAAGAARGPGRTADGQGGYRQTELRAARRERESE